MSSLKKIRVAIVCGGRSSEHEISCISANGVLSALDQEKFEAILIGITEATGDWVLLDKTAPFSKKSNGLPEVPTSAPKLIADIHGIKNVDGTDLEVDAFFPLLHGAYGEDGTIQGLFEMMAMPYVGSGVLASTVAMDKSFAKPIYASFGLAIAEGFVLQKRDWESNKSSQTEKISKMGFPIFIKPARSGSSRGTSKVKSTPEIESAVNAALALDPKVMIEKAVIGRELECAVLEVGGEVRTSVVGEVRVLGDHEFYDFEAKYLDGSTEFDIPAKISVEKTNEIQNAARKAFQALGCEGLARVDFFLTPEGTVIINELNTLPGFTATSVFPKLWQATGRNYSSIITTLIDSALSRSQNVVR